MSTVEDRLRALAARHRGALERAIETRVGDMERDDESHFLIYRVLGVEAGEGRRIDLYQNKGRFLYRYAGSFLEEAARLCFRERYPDAGSLRLPNTLGSRPRSFQIDCLVGREAIEIKWRDATTDGDHITKEHTRLEVIAAAGYRPVRVMFYYPNRTQAVRIQKTLETLYAGAGGEYHFGDAAWRYVGERTGVDLKAIIERLADEHDHA